LPMRRFCAVSMIRQGIMHKNKTETRAAVFIISGAALLFRR
jgi:hypothetical protein